ncbi:MAG: trimeric intracellular cation channel family protein [Acidithiobacillus sp.]|uniref:trimeric intracellular cation channel family protein n=1 Tax=Acidithiobacillus sp. TaxID=1872118 RepID=UPI0025BF86B3|nr:trimeric intracellular cation channel family protein [Acidithiobacillus sp.]
MHTDAPLLLLHAINLIGIFVFAVSGAMRGVRSQLDIFGIIVLAVVTAVFGGIVRDLLIGAIPPESITDWHSVALAVFAGVFVFFFHRLFDRLQHPVLLFDAAGLGVFAATGTQKALAFGLSPFMAAVLGVISGIGGGMVRDVLSGQVPVVLRAEIYASAAALGCVLVLAGDALHLPPLESTLAGAALTFFLRTMALYRHWSLPRAR